MRALFAAIGLSAACYRPPTEAHCTVVCGTSRECPTGLACNSGGYCTPNATSCEAPGDAGVDVAPDASILCNAFTSQPRFLFRGDSYIQYGVYSVWWNSQDGQIYTMRGNSTGPVATGYLQPRLSTDGNEILMLDNAKVIYRTTWDGSAWLDKTAVETNVMVAPGTMTKTAPRVMIATEGGQLYRGVEMSRAWSFDPIGTLGLVAASDPSVNPDETRLVFVGTDGNNNKAIYLAVADGSSDGWSEPQLLFDQAGDETTPFLTPDCMQLTYSVAGVTFIVP